MGYSDKIYSDIKIVEGRKKVIDVYVYRARLGMEAERNMFRSVSGGFQMTFSNGLTISVMFRGGNYCEHRNAAWEAVSDNIRINGFHGSKDAEIAIWNSEDTWLRFGYDQVKGWCSANEVADWICRASSADTLASLQAEIEEGEEE